MECDYGMCSHSIMYLSSRRDLRWLKQRPLWLVHCQTRRAHDHHTNTALNQTGYNSKCPVSHTKSLAVPQTELSFEMKIKAVSTVSGLVVHGIFMNMRHLSATRQLCYDGRVGTDICCQTMRAGFHRVGVNTAVLHVLPTQVLELNSQCCLLRRGLRIWSNCKVHFLRIVYCVIFVWSVFRDSLA